MTVVLLITSILLVNVFNDKSIHTFVAEFYVVNYSSIFTFVSPFRNTFMLKNSRRIQLVIVLDLESTHPIIITQTVSALLT